MEIIWSSRWTSLSRSPLSFYRWTVKPDCLIILSVVLRFILLTFLLGKVNIVVLLHVVGKAWPYPQIVLAGEQKPTENSSFECGVTVKRLHTATPSVIDGNLFGVFYHCLFDIINLSGWSIFQWYCTLGHFSPLCLIPLHRSYLACADFNLLECFSSPLY